ncbi:MAG TPA: alpha/beta hydrolase [Anaeromyxobacteraceae bacterium]|nr:alpha/beta hydrolase [Anaeromyxobacteraceae bacterium]
MESFATASDGTRIWWRAAGRGAPPVVLVDGIACAGFIWRDLFPRLAAHRRVLHWNYRGHGRSERPKDLARTSLSDAVDDLLAVMDAARARSAVLVGHSVGVQVCLEAHRRAPRRVRALVLLCGSPGHPLHTWHGRPLLEAVFPLLKQLAVARPEEARWVFRNIVPSRAVLELGRRFEVNRELMPRADLQRYLDDVSGIDPEVFVRMLASAARHDSARHLPHVDVPTLIVAGERDTWTPLERSRAMHAAIPGSELLVVPDATHTAALERPDLVGDRLVRFLEEHAGRPPRKRARRGSPAA